MAFIEGAYRGDLSNWWIPNSHALELLARSAGLKVVARPHPAEMLVCGAGAALRYGPLRPARLSALREARR